MNLEYRKMIGIKRIYDVYIFDKGNMCNKNSMNSKLHHKWDWMKGETNQGHTITHKCSQIPAQQLYGHGRRKWK